MKIDSLGISTDLIFNSFIGEVIFRDEYIVVRRPTNQTFRGGNFLIFPNPPQAEDMQRWPQIFKNEFSDLHTVKHVAFTWDSSLIGQHCKAFQDDGYCLETNKLLSATALKEPTKFNHEVLVRTIESNQDWEDVVQEQLLIRGDFDPTRFEIFKRAQMHDYRRMAESGRGKWFGAYLDGRLVADLGAYFKGDLVRYQNVLTHPEFRRRGICAKLIYDAAAHAIRHFAASTLVIAADVDHHAAGIYESLGFTQTETRHSLTKAS